MNNLNTRDVVNILLCVIHLFGRINVLSAVRSARRRQLDDLPLGGANRDRSRLRDDRHFDRKNLHVARHCATLNDIEGGGCR